MHLSPLQTLVNYTSLIYLVSDVYMYYVIDREVRYTYVCTYVCDSSGTVEPPNNGHIGGKSLVLCWEVALKIKFY